MQYDAKDSADPRRVREAADRLSGQLVRTPLVGGILLGDAPASPRLRAKLEVLQPGGGAVFRGAMHSLSRALGTLSGLVVGGGFRSAYATALAASLQRIPTVVLIGPNLDESCAARFAVLPQVRVERSDVVGRDEVLRRARAEGFRAAPGPGDDDWELGVATLGLELAEQMPGDTDLVVVGPGVLRRAVQRGLVAGGRSLEVLAPEARLAGDLGELRRRVREGLRIEADAAGLRALELAQSAALEGREVVAVLGA